MSEIIRHGTSEKRIGAPEYFTGKVVIDMSLAWGEPSRLVGGIATFEPGARTVWHSHPIGQTLYITEGVCWHQCWGEPIVEAYPGDVIWCPPGHKHWHGASPNSPMVHFTVQEGLNGKYVELMEPVAEEDYLAGPPKG